MNKLLSLALLGFCALTGSSQTFHFGVHSSPSHEGNIAAHGDLNGDGNEDLIAYHFGGGGFDVILSNGDGSYRAPVFYSTAGVLDEFQVADFNGDGKLDLLARSPVPSGVDIFFGKRDGTFRAPVLYHLSRGAAAIAAADVNHDNKTDLIVATNPDANHNFYVYVLLANGDGSFRNGPTTDSIDVNYLGLIYPGDFDGDGKVDIALVLLGGDGGTTLLQVRYGDGAGNFSQPYEARDDSATAIAAGDVNGDGKTDLISTAYIDPDQVGGGPQHYLIAFYGRSDRTLEPVEIPIIGFGVGQPAVADFNGDHIPDIAFQEFNDAGIPSSVAILPGKGKNDFGSEQTVYHTSNRPDDPHVVRANRDTKADLVFNGRDYSQDTVDAIVTLLNQTTGSFPSCGAPNAAIGIALCSPTPGSTVSSPVDFAIGSAGDTPMRKAEVWSDGHKIAEQLAGSFSNYSFLDASLPLATGSHHIVVFAAGWDNSLESRSYTLNVTAPSCAAPSSPGVHVCSPANGSTVHSPVRLEAVATVSGTLARMEVWVDGVKKYTSANHVDTSIPLSAGSHRFAFLAINMIGQIWQTTVNAVVQ